MAKKFFYNRVYNTRRTIINIVIIGVCVIGIIICFLITSNFQGENRNTPEKVLNIKNEVTVEVNDTYTKNIFFSKVENVDLDTVDIDYPNDFDIATPGRYKVTLTINQKNYSTTLVVVDTTKPTLILKNVTINEGQSYNSKDFVTSCYDNSNDACNLNFAYGVDEDGNKVDYANYKETGTYTIKISAKDNSDNETIEETKLIITKNDTKPEKPVETVPQVCKYGNNLYDTDNYLIAIDVTSDNCAVSLDLYKDTTMTEGINKLMNTETTRIKKDVDALNLSGTFALNRKITAVINTTGDGIVGYELSMTVTVTNNNNSTVVAEYKLNNNGQRVFTQNPYNLSN